MLGTREPVDVYCTAGRKRAAAQRTARARFQWITKRAGRAAVRYDIIIVIIVIIIIIIIVIINNNNDNNIIIF